MRLGWAPPLVHLNIISGRGGLGDQIARLPAYRYMHDTYEHVSATIYVQDGFRDVVEYILPPTPRRSYKKLSEAPWTLKKPIVEFDMERLTTLNLHLTDHAFLILMDMLPPTKADKAYPRACITPHYVWDNYLIQNPERKYIVFTTDYTAEARQWPACHVNELARRCGEAGVTPVLLGTSEPIPTGVEGDPVRPQANSGIQSGRFLDLRGKTTLVEALGIIQRAKCVVGIDNGLLHLAHCTDTPAVMGFTTLKPEHRVPVRMHNQRIDRDGRVAQLTKTLEAQVPCAGCQSRGFAVNHDWRTCLFDDYACTLTLTADRYWEKLKELNAVL